MLAVDVIFLNRTAFLVMSARKIKFVTVNHIPSHTADQLSRSFNKVIKLYGQRGFVMSMILMDMDLDKVEDELGKA